MIAQFERKQESCMKYENDFLGTALHKSSPYLYPFVIEYAMIGASMFYLMWMHVGKMPKGESAFDGNMIHKPHPREFLRKRDWTHTFNGVLAGIVVVLLAFINLGLFFGLDGAERNEDKAEFCSKLVNTITNVIGIVGVVFGLYQVSSLKLKDRDHEIYDEASMASDKLDLSLLRFTLFFSYLYHNFTVITGSFNHHITDFPNSLHIINGVVEAVQVTLQLMLIIELKKRELPEDQMSQKPGREVTVFLFLLNLAQWIVFTFEIQKVRASVVEADFYGFLPWVIIQRVTLPLTVFFRFHSAVVSLELWKETYSKSI